MYPPFPYQHPQPVTDLRGQFQNMSMMQEQQKILPPNYPTHAQFLGRGTYGTVYAVYDPRFREKVALKTMDNLFMNMTTAKNAIREIKLLAALKHENILSIKDIMIPENQNSFNKIYLMTEIMETDLYKLVAHSKNINEPHVNIFMYQLMRGLKFLHSANIIHRDIKPSNLLINGYNCSLKIIDFGMARYLDPKSEKCMKNISMNVVTHMYRAPELLTGGTRYSFGVDIWAAACVFYELIAGKILFNVEDTTTNVPQLEKIVEILGTPSAQDLKNIPEGARNHILNTSPNSAKKLDNMLNYDPSKFLYATPEAKALLSGLLQFNPDNRWTADYALNHVYFNYGRHLFHNSEIPLCACCKNGIMENPNNPEPIFPPDSRKSLEDDFQDKTIYDMRNDIYQFINNANRGFPKMTMTGNVFTVLPN